MLKEDWRRQQFPLVSPWNTLLQCCMGASNTNYLKFNLPTSLGTCYSYGFLSLPVTVPETWGLLFPTSHIQKITESWRRALRFIRCCIPGWVQSTVDGPPAPPSESPHPPPHHSVNFISLGLTLAPSSLLDFALGIVLRRSAMCRSEGSCLCLQLRPTPHNLISNHTYLFCFLKNARWPMHMLVLPPENVSLPFLSWPCSIHRSSLGPCLPQEVSSNPCSELGASPVQPQHPALFLLFLNP